MPAVMSVQPPLVWRDAQADRWSAQESGDDMDQASVAHMVTDAYWRWNDPRPALDHFLERVGQALAKRTRT